MAAMTVQQSISAATVPKQNQILAQDPNQEWQLPDLGSHRHRLPVPTQILTASRARPDMGKLRVLARNLALMIPAIAFGWSVRRFVHGDASIW